MSVEVLVTTNNTEAHPAGKGAVVHDGHLTVLDDQAEAYASTIAIYSPGYWVSVVVKDSDQD